MMMDMLTATLAPYALAPLGTLTDDGQSIVLVGPDEPAFWPVFTQSPEYKDGAPDPMDRWSRRVFTHIAATLDAEPLFPFGGPPYAPFYSWAINTGRFWTSPISFLVHDKAGLFASFRGALRVPGAFPQAKSTKPCDTCAQPCVTACPVDAFASGYDVTACKTHVSSDKGRDCRTGGCLARRACPIGQANRLPAQSAFHMESFL
ncbi:ferredoxin [Loktanella sp. D2R18]|nr:ferredoxin [Loktanella sp. D2R18]